MRSAWIVRSPGQRAQLRPEQPGGLSRRRFSDCAGRDCWFARVERRWEDDFAPLPRRRLRPTAGEVTWRGEAAGSCPAARRLVGFLGHESGLYRALTAWENLLFAGRMCGIDHVGDRAAELLSSFGLHRQAQQTVGRLSRGMRQRLAIARAVIHDPPILLLDEPFTSLDASGRCWLVEFLCGLRQRSRAILLATHEAAESRCFADRLLGLHADGLQGVWRASELGSASLPRKTSEVSKTSEVF